MKNTSTTVLKRVIAEARVWPFINFPTFQLPDENDTVAEFELTTDQ